MDKHYGFCHLSLIPLRSQASDKSELSTQLIFGQLYQVLAESEDKKWLRIRIEEDAYEAWLSHNQFFAISTEEAQRIKSQTLKIVLDTIAWVEHSGFTFAIPLGAALPWDENRLFSLRNTQFALSPAARISRAEADSKQMLSRAMMYRGSPYLWGGKSPFGIDCSGFSQMVYKMMGMLLPRDAYQQAEQGESRRALVDAQTGDLAFFQREGRIVHVGLLIAPSDLKAVAAYKSPRPGDYHIMHAYDSVRVDPLDDRGIFNGDLKAYTHELALLKHLF